MGRGGKQTEWTTEEARIVFDNKEKTPKELHDLLPNKTLKGLSYALYKARAVGPKEADFILENYKNTSASKIDTRLKILKGVSAFYLKSLGLERVWRGNSYTEEEIATVEKYCGLPGYTHEVIAGILKIPAQRVTNIAVKYGIESEHRLSLEARDEICKKYESGIGMTELAEQYGKTANGIRNLLYRMGAYTECEEQAKKNSIYRTNKCEKFIMDYISEEFGVVFPKKSKENRDYYWGIIPPYEVDIPFELEGVKFAIEYDGEYWHADKKDIDEKKENLLMEKGYWFWRISSADHDHRFEETLKPIVKTIAQSIKQILLKERSTTIPVAV